VNSCLNAAIECVFGFVNNVLGFSLRACLKFILGDSIYNSW